MAQLDSSAPVSVTADCQDIASDVDTVDCNDDHLVTDHITPDMCEFSFDRHSCESSSTPGLTTDDSSESQDWDLDHRPPSPAPSVYSLTSSIIAQSFREEYGRKVNNYSDVYNLPADEAELARLQKQNTMFEEMMGRYPPGMRECMQPDNGPRKAIVDLGCGCGSWIMQAARDFPECEALAIDLIPMQSTEMPSNCRSEIDDINLGLEHHYGKFDVVHARLISSGIQHYPGLVDHIARMLKPGGMVEFSEWDFRAYDSDHRPLNDNKEDSMFSWLGRFFIKCGKAARARGGNVDAANSLKRWCEENPAFENVTQEDYWLPCSAWCTEEGSKADQQRKWGAAMAEDISNFVSGARPLLLNNGMSLEEFEELETKTKAELAEGKVPTTARYQTILAHKRPRSPL